MTEKEMKNKLEELEKIVKRLTSLLNDLVCIIGDNIDNKYHSQISTVRRFLEKASEDKEKDFSKVIARIKQVDNILCPIIKSLEPEKVCSK